MTLENKDLYFEPDKEKIIRVFPRKTHATPDDEYVRFSIPSNEDKKLIDINEIKEVHISVTFEEDREKGLFLFDSWKKFIDSIKIGGIVFGSQQDIFISGKYIKKGFTITSRGCPFSCWFCKVHKSEGNIKEIPIVKGNDILDSNFLATSQNHQELVFQMLSKEEKKIKFTGGLDTRFFTEFHCNWLKKINLQVAYFAYDDESRYDDLVKASETLKKYGFLKKLSNKFKCYCIMGYPNDTIAKAKERIHKIIDLNITPMAMLYNKKNQDKLFRDFYRLWANPICNEIASQFVKEGLSL